VVYGSLEQVSGGYRYDREAARLLRARGDEVEVASLVRLPWPLSLLQDALPSSRRLFAAEGARGPDVVVVDELVHGAVSRSVARRPSRCPPVLVMVHHLTSREDVGPVVSRRARVTERRLLEAADRIVASSRATEATVRDLVPAPPPLAVCTPGSDAASALPGRAGRSGPPRILVTGNVIPRKGHDLLLEALAPLKALAWELRIVGAPVDRRYLRRLQATVRREGLGARVCFAGLVPPGGMAAEYGDAAVFAFPSRYEGYGISLAEAMRAGLPVVAFDAGGTAEVARGAAGLVPAGDVAAFREALRGLLSDQAHRAREGARCRELAAALPTWPESAACFARELDLAARGGTQGGRRGTSD
jgi:glycosyltransferase involved in cell wall biosynthesis